MPRSNETLLRMAAICLPLILAVVAARSALKPRKDAPAVSAAIPSVEGLDLLAGYLSARSAQNVPVIALATGVSMDGPDPFTSVEEARAPLILGSEGLVPRDRYVVTAILISNTKRIAVVNETLVSVGSTLPGGARVTAIENDHVAIVSPGGVRRLITVRD